MIMKYRVLRVTEETGSLSVNFYTDEYPEGLTYSVDIPIENGQYVSGEVLERHIMSFAPYGQIQRALLVRGLKLPEIPGEKLT